MYKIIIEDPHLVHLKGLGDHQIRTPLENEKKVSKLCKASLRILTFSDLGVLGIVI
jgi:hypothetical protein